MSKAKAYSAASATSPLASAKINRREATKTDVQIEILFCGICHSDLHTARGEWDGIMPTTFPCVPGHEIVGTVAETGEGVEAFSTGDLSGCEAEPLQAAEVEIRERLQDAGARGALQRE